MKWTIQLLGMGTRVGWIVRNNMDPLGMATGMRVIDYLCYVVCEGYASVRGATSLKVAIAISWPLKVDNVYYEDDLTDSFQSPTFVRWVLSNCRLTLVLTY